LAEPEVELGPIEAVRDVAHNGRIRTDSPARRGAVLACLASSGEEVRPATDADREDSDQPDDEGRWSARFGCRLDRWLTLDRRGERRWLLGPTWSARWRARHADRLGRRRRLGGRSRG